MIYSTLLPGLGDIYLGERKKGLITSLIGVSILASTLKIRSNYNDSRDQYNTDRFAYENATSAADIKNTFVTMNLSFSDADNKKKLADGMTIVTGLFWVYNFWDATRYRTPALYNDGTIKMKNRSKEFYWNNRNNSLGFNIWF